MPHQCVHCGKFYEDASQELLRGCECGSRFFFFFKKPLEQQEAIELSTKDKREIEYEVRKIIGKNIDDEKPVILDMESIRVKKPGKFEIDLVNLFKRKPLVYKIEEGKYIIDLASTFQIKKKGEK